MPTVLAQLDAAFRVAIRDALGLDADPVLSPSQTDKFGDYQSNAAMGLAKAAKSNPRAVAEQIRAELDLGGLASETSIAGPGFINVRLSPAWLAGQVERVAGDGRLGVEPVAAPQAVVIDYSGPNVAKQMHVGHLRSTIIGDAIARVLSFQGQAVVRQNHIGDWGTQFGMLISLLKRTDADGSAEIEDLDGFYKEARRQFDADPAVADEARATVVRLQGGGEQELALWRQIVGQSRAHFQPIYDRLGVQLTAADERGESFYNPMLAGNVAELKSAGVATESEGAVVVFTDGSETPLIVEKTGGGYGYATTDLSAIRYRVGELHADRIVYVVGSPQGQHFKQVFAAARKAGWAGEVVLEHAAFGSVLGEDGKMFKSRERRHGEVGRPAGRGRGAGVRARVDARARTCPTAAAGDRQGGRAGRREVRRSVQGPDRRLHVQLRQDAGHGRQHGPVPAVRLRPHPVDLPPGGRAGRRRPRPFAAAVTLETPHELALAKHVLRFGEVVELVARELKPHHLCAYLYELATRFSGFFENCPVLSSEGPQRDSRLTLCEAAGRTLARGLDLLGIEHPDQM